MAAQKRTAHFPLSYTILCSEHKSSRRVYYYSCQTLRHNQLRLPASLSENLSRWLSLLGEQADNDRAIDKNASRKSLVTLAHLITANEWERLKLCVDDSELATDWGTYERATYKGRCYLIWAEWIIHRAQQLIEKLRIPIPLKWNKHESGRIFVDISSVSAPADNVIFKRPYSFATRKPINQSTERQ